MTATSVQEEFDVIVIGSGLAGLKAAELAAAAGMRTATVESQLFGGLAIGINELEGLPGGELVSGVSLAGAIMAHGVNLGVETISATATGISHSGSRLLVATEAGVYAARHIIVASGAARRQLGVPGESEFRYRGISECANCDGPLYAGQDVVVVGGGDSALQEAAALARYVRQVTIVHRRREFRARPEFVRAVEALPNVRLLLGQTVDAVIGADGVTGVRLRDIDTRALREEPCTGFFAYVGLNPNSAFLPPTVHRNPVGAVLVTETLETSMPAVFAIGAVRAAYGGRIVDAWTDAERAVAAL